MKISQKDSYIFIDSTENSFLEFFEAYISKNINYKESHVVIQLSENLNTTLEDLSLFLSVATNHKSHGTSFVVICKEIDIDEVPDEINVVPTLLEAEDVLEMEAIERDLGF